MQQQLPLEGITVVSIEQAVAAPFATRQLADLGARVIKVERPGDGDFARRYDRTVHGQSSYFVWLNRSKESVTLDLKDERGQEILHQLLAEADVFVQNLAPGAADRLGLGPDALTARYPRLIPCTVSGYGTSGPWADRKAYDLLIQCQTGLVSLTGTAEETARVGISVADISAGMYAYSGILTALFARATSGVVHAGGGLALRGARGMDEPARLLHPAQRHPAATDRHPARHHRPVRRLHRGRRQGRPLLHPERARMGRAVRRLPRPARTHRRPALRHRLRPRRPPRRAQRHHRRAVRRTVLPPTS